MERPECSICDNIFDSNDHRPRALPCGHGFCSLCIDTAIRRGDRKCAICRKEHGASSSTDLPVSFILEDFAHKLSVSSFQKHDSDLVEESNYGMCPKHKEIPLYFLCKTHSIKVCHSCAVIDHPPSSCQLISFEEEIKERKNVQIEAAKKQNQAIMNMERDLHILHQQNVGEIELLVTKIEKMNQEINEKKKSQENIKEAIRICQQKQKYFDISEKKLSSATSNQEIGIQCEQGKIDVLHSREWEEITKKELNIEQLYVQVEMRGVLRSSRVFEENGSVYILCLSREVPPNSSRLMKEEKLGLDSTTIKVFLDISEGGNTLGQVFISVFNNTYHGQYFIEMVLGINGLSIKGTNFIKRNTNFVQLEDYMTEDGSKEKIPFTSYDENQKHTRPIKGMLSPNGTSFIIWKNDGGRGRDSKWPYHFGTIDSGMNVIDTIASRNMGVTEIIISGCGIVLNS